MGIGSLLSSVSRSDIIAGISVLVALGLGGINLCRDCAQDSRLEEIEYQTLSIEHRPLLRVVGQPEVLNLEISGGARFATADLTSKAETDTPVLRIPSRLSVRVNLRLANTGNALAKVRVLAMTDTTSGADKIRRVWLEHFLPAEDTSFFKTMDIVVGDTTSYTQNWEVQFVSDNSFTLHFFVLYANESGALFDTYYWARYDAIPLEVLFRREVRNGMEVLIPTNDPQSKSDVLKFRDSNQSTYAYTLEETRQIEALLD